MINEEKVKELFSVALYDKKDNKMHQQVKGYFMQDYLGKEVLKSIFSGTLAFIGLAALYVMYNMDEIMENINSMDLVGTAFRYLMVYIVFMAGYIFVTILVYSIRYSVGRKRFNSNGEHLKKIKNMYEREEKLKL